MRMKASVRVSWHDDRRVDLRPLLAHPDAAEMLMLARGQLNRAFRRHGLLPPDIMAAGAAAAVDLDDPAANGSVRAEARFGTAFTAWAVAMAPELVAPVLAILTQTAAALGPQPEHEAARTAVSQARRFLKNANPAGRASEAPPIV
jgi:hypothetical protein